MTEAIYIAQHGLKRGTTDIRCDVAAADAYEAKMREHVCHRVFADRAPYDQEPLEPSYEVMLEMALKGSAYEVVQTKCTELTCPQHGEANRRARGESS